MRGYLLLPYTHKQSERRMRDFSKETKSCGIAKENQETVVSVDKKGFSSPCNEQKRKRESKQGDYEYNQTESTQTQMQMRERENCSSVYKEEKSK